jgi:uncharacterized protein with PIN domain
MKKVNSMLNPWEHCPDCGALLVASCGSSICSHCGYESYEPSESLVYSLTARRDYWGIGARFHLMDDQIGEAA